MADNGAKVPSPPFDVRTIKDLVALMSRHDLSEIDLREGEMRIRLRRGPLGNVQLMSPLTTSAPSMPALSASVPAAASAPAPAAKPAGKNLIEIKAQTPGTFYAAPNPEAPPFVRVGARVTPTTTVCIIEAMKVMNEIQADCNGTIAEICVENGEPVEYEKVLFRVDPSA